MGLNVPAPGLPSSAYKLDRMFILIPTVVCAYPALISPLLIYLTADPGAAQLTTEVNSRIENKIFWPLVALLSITLAWRRFGYLTSIKAPAGLLFLAMYMALAGCSVLWSVEPDTTMRRMIHEIMVLISIVLPISLSERRGQVFSDLFMCFAAVAVINLVFVVTHPPTPFGHAGYYDHKNSLGMHVAFSYIFAIHEIFKGSPLRRAFAAFVAIVSLFLLIVSQSKTSLGLATLIPILAMVIVLLVRRIAISPAWLVFYSLNLVAVAIAPVLDSLGLSIDDVSIFLFGDDTFTGRTTIWSFAMEMAEPRLLLGWGYQAFWGESPDAPGRLGPGWVAQMPTGHNGYIDTVLGTGLIGLTLLLSMIVSAFIGSKKIVERSVRLGGLVMSLMLFAIVHNGLETTFLRGATSLWVVFVIILTFLASAADKYRHISPTQLRKPQTSSLRLSYSTRSDL